MLSLLIIIMDISQEVPIEQRQWQTLQKKNKGNTVCDMKCNSIEGTDELWSLCTVLCPEVGRKWIKNKNDFLKQFLRFYLLWFYLLHRVCATTLEIAGREEVGDARENGSGICGHGEGL